MTNLPTDILQSVVLGRNFRNIVLENNTQGRNTLTGLL